MIYSLFCVRFFSCLRAFLYVFSSIFLDTVNLTEISYRRNTLLISTGNPASLVISLSSLMPTRETAFPKTGLLSLSGSLCKILIGMFRLILGLPVVRWHRLRHFLKPLLSFLFHQKVQNLPLCADFLLCSSFFVPLTTPFDVLSQIIFSEVLSCRRILSFSSLL